MAATSKISNKDLSSISSVVSGLAGDLDSNSQDFGAMNYMKEVGKYAGMGSTFGPIGTGIGAAVGAGIGLFKDSQQEKLMKEAKTKKEQAIKSNFLAQNMAEGGIVTNFEEIKEGETVDDYLKRLGLNPGKNDPLYTELKKEDYKKDQSGIISAPKEYLLLDDWRKAEQNLLAQYTNRLGKSLYGEEEYDEIQENISNLKKENKKEELAKYQEELGDDYLDYEGTKELLGEEHASRYYDLIKRNYGRHSSLYPESPWPLLGQEEVSQIEEEGTNKEDYIENKKLKLGKKVFTTLGPLEKVEDTEKSREYIDTEKNSYAKGGEVDGSGGPKEDKVKSNVKPGSFIVPEKNADIAMAIGQKYLGWDKNQEAKKKKSKGKNVNLSDGEVHFQPEEVQKLIEAGISKQQLNQLAPNAKSKLEEGEGYADGYSDLVKSLITVPGMEQESDAKMLKDMDISSDSTELKSDYEPELQTELEGVNLNDNTEDDEDNDDEEENSFLEQNLGYLLGGTKAIAGAGLLSGLGKTPDINTNVNIDSELGAIDSYYNELISEVSKGMSPFEKANLDKNLEGIYANTVRSVAEASQGDPARAAALSVVGASNIADQYTKLAAAEASDRKTKIANAIAKKVGTKSTMQGRKFAAENRLKERKDQRDYQKYQDKSQLVSNLIGGGTSDIIGQQQQNTMAKIMENLPDTTLESLFNT